MDGVRMHGLFQEQLPRREMSHTNSRDLITPVHTQIHVQRAAANLDYCSADKVTTH